MNTKEQLERQRNCTHEFILVPVDPMSGERILTAGPVPHDGYAAGAYCIRCGASGDNPIEMRRPTLSELGFTSLSDITAKSIIDEADAEEARDDLPSGYVLLFPHHRIPAGWEQFIPSEPVDVATVPEGTTPLVYCKKK